MLLNKKFQYRVDKEPIFRPCSMPIESTSLLGSLFSKDAFCKMFFLNDIASSSTAVFINRCFVTV
jgi:hypothetical protein